jgi:hypothetical protein
MRISLTMLALASVGCSDGGSGGAADLAAAADLAIPIPSFPSSLAPPAGQSILLHAIGKGAQIYACSSGSSGADAGTSYAFVFVAPDASLFDEQMNVIGHHSAGPTWMLNDGSQIVGTVLSKAPGPDPTAAIPWLLLTVSSNVGAGKLASAAYVQRLDTHGGVAPTTGCDTSTVGIQARVDYTADYYFWGP